MFTSRPRRAKIELAKRIQQRVYQEQPLKWLNERLGEPTKNYKWSEYPEYKQHEWDGTPDPFNVFLNALAQKKWVGLESATSTGKTFLIARAVYWFLDVFPNSLVVTTAPTSGQLEKMLWKEINILYPRFRKIRPHALLNTLNLLVDGRIKRVRWDKGAEMDRIMETTGWQATGFVSQIGAGEESATKMQGFHRENMLFVLDEGAGIHSAVYKAIENTSTGSNNLVIAMGNPDSQTDPLHNFCTMNRVEHITVSALDHPNIVLQNELIKGAVSQQSIDFRAEEYGVESQFYRSRVRGISPTESTDSLFKAAYIDQCNVNDKQNFILIDHVTNRDNMNALGVDVANSLSGDKACLAWGRGNELQELDEFACPDANFLAYNCLYDRSKIIQLSKNLTATYNVQYNTSKISQYEIRANNIGVDVVGVGAGTINTFWAEGVKAIPIQGGQLKEAIKTDREGKLIYEFANLRSQMYFEAAEDTRKGDIRINIPLKEFRALKKELTIIKFKITGGKIAVESKENIKKRLGGKSPNAADAFVYWNWVRKNLYKPARSMPFSSGMK